MYYSFTLLWVLVYLKVLQPYLMVILAYYRDVILCACLNI